MGVPKILFIIHALIQFFIIFLAALAIFNTMSMSVLERTGERFTLVVLAARRARQINAYFNQLGEGIGGYVPPQVHSLSRKPLSIAFEEIAADKVVVDTAE